MKNFVYRKLSRKQFYDISSYCEENNIEYDIWNPEDLCLPLYQEIEFGLECWDRIPITLLNTNVQ